MKCSCGEKFKCVPKYARRVLDESDPLAGWYWECPVCQSTQFLPANEKLSLQDYFDALNDHDWHYSFTDDNSVWTMWDRNNSRLLKIAGQSIAHMELYQKFHDHNFTGPAWKNTQQPLPERPNNGTP